VNNFGLRDQIDCFLIEVSLEFSSAQALSAASLSLRGCRQTHEFRFGSVSNGSNVVK
jgi:hypothetical protein